jgi:hypothetical protein
MMPANMESQIEKPADPQSAHFREQLMLTVKVLLIAGGTLGLLALLDWVAVS